jgi:hypothetical protein
VGLGASIGSFRECNRGGSSDSDRRRTLVDCRGMVALHSVSGDDDNDGRRCDRVFVMMVMVVMLLGLGR